jgi:surface antigen
MKKPFYFTMLAALFLTGCGDKNSGGGSPVTAPVDYLNAAGNAQKKALKTVDVASLNQAVAAFNATEGRNPKDLNELIETKYIGKLPDAPYGSKIVYDASTGKVSVVPK